MDHWGAIAEERRALADVLDGLSDDQWETRSLCEAWTVRDVAAHLVLPHETSMLSFMLAFLLARGSFDRANVTMTARVARRPPAELAAAVRAHAEGRFAPPGYGSEAPLADMLIHGEDIRVPLGLVADRPAEAWTPVIDFLVTPKARRTFVGRSLGGYRFVATDTGWEHGDGPEVRGPVSALALAMAGRRVRVDELDGPGLPRLVGA